MIFEFKMSGWEISNVSDRFIWHSRVKVTFEQSAHFTGVTKVAYGVKGLQVNEISMNALVLRE